MSEKKELKKLSETLNDILNIIDKIGDILDKIEDNLGAYMWILPGVLFVIFCISVKIDYYKFSMIILLLLLFISGVIFNYTKTHITVIKSLKDNYSNFFINKWFPQYMFENDENKEKKNNTSKVSNIVASVIYYLITNPLILQWFIRIIIYVFMIIYRCYILKIFKMLF